MPPKPPAALFESQLSSLPLLGRGKVRDLYAIDDEYLLIVTTDRLSAFDVVLPDPIPGKGAVLTALSRFWFERMSDLITNQLAPLELAECLADPAERAQVEGRALIVRRLQPLPVEAIARGYLIGSGWRDYQASGQLCGLRLPAGLRQAERLPEAVFTPSTKAATGDHDQNITFDELIQRFGAPLAGRIRATTLRLYTEAAAYAEQRGLLIADTKFEFALDAAGELVWIDEALTPDSSRFWPAAQYALGTSPPSFDKQYVRDYLDTLDWDKTAPAPRLPAAVIERTAAKYQEAQYRLMG